MSVELLTDSVSPVELDEELTTTIGNKMPAFTYTLKHTAAMVDLTVSQRELIDEAFTINLDHVKNESFKTTSAEKVYFGGDKKISAASTGWYHPMIDNELVGESAPPSSLLNTEQEKFIFLRYNYARKRAQEALNKFKTHPGKAVAKELSLWYSRVKDTRDIITQANLALVLAMAKRTRMSEVDFGELVSEGNMALLRAIEKFDIARGFKFSTYACRAILKAFSRIAMKTSRYRQAFPAEYDPAMEKSDYLENRRADAEKDAVEELQRIIGENRAHLSDVERTVIQARFALNRTAEDTTAMTLEEVGQVIGVTKERVRQIQNKALEKLRVVIESEVLAR